MQDVNNRHSVIVDTVKNQVITVGTPADAVAFVSRHQGKFVSRYYNHSRLHSTNDYQTPAVVDALAL